MARCEIVVHLVPEGPPYYASGGSRPLLQCNTHGMTDFAPAACKDLLCPIGKIEQAVEDGLARIDARLKKLEE